MGAKITLMGPEWISLDGSPPKVQEPCYFLDRENVFRGVMDESGDVYEILDNDTNDVVYHSNIKEEGIRQGIWLCIQRLVHMEQYDMAKYFIKLFGFDRNECEMLLDKNGSDDKMESFIIQMVFNKDDKIILDDIGYHKIGSIFKYNIDSKEVELEVVESSDASCEGCAFNNSKNYYCKDTHCIDVDRKDDIDVIYKKVKRS